VYRQLGAIGEEFNGQIILVRLCFGLARPLVTGGIVHFSMMSISLVPSKSYHVLLGPAEYYRFAEYIS